ncbi:MAG: putative zinc-binding protein [Anaerolineae bacterium]
MSDDKRVLIIPCSGIGKAYGSVGREAMYKLLEDLRPGVTDTLCLSLLTLGDPEAQARVREHPTITIDGCPKACAKVNVEAAGGAPAGIYRVFDVYRAHKELKVRSVSELGESGRAMARLLAEEIALKVDQLRASPDSHCAASLVVDEVDEAQCELAPQAEENQ